MQALDWNDLRYLLAVARCGTLAAAARQAGVDATTISRRLRAAEAALGARLFERLPNGKLRPTPMGEAAIPHAEKAEASVDGMVGAVTGADAAPAGMVRVTAVPILASRVLVPAANSLTTRYPQLRLELIADPREMSLAHREVDLALRLARPLPGAGRAMLTRRIGRLSYAAYAAASCTDDTKLPWVGYEAGMADIPPARWLAQAARLQERAAIAVNDAEAIVQAVGAGLGRSILPRVVGEREIGLRRIAVTAALPPLPVREIWLLTHPDLQPLARVAAVREWIERTVVECAE